MKVRLTYYKDTEKYYGEGEYKTEKEFLFEIWDEVREMLKKGKRPGLTDGHDGLHVLINVAGHEHEHPRLMLRVA